MERIADFLKKCGTYYLATVDGTQPRVRPFGTINIFDGKLYIQTGKIKQVSKELHTNPCFEISAFDGEKWIRLSGKAVEDDRAEARKSMLDAYPSLRAMYDENDGNTEVFYITEGKAVFSSFTAAPETIEF